MTHLSPSELHSLHVPARLGSMPIAEFRRLQHEARARQFWSGLSVIQDMAKQQPRQRDWADRECRSRLMARIAELNGLQTFHAAERADLRGKGMSDDHELMRHHGARLAWLSDEIDRCDLALSQLSASEGVEVSQAAE